ncbi:RH1 [Snake adenovirus 1]|uniref:Protein RH1 n=1 Tax=Snake adenovirus serotype 1 TaxID=189830 RepID=RH1_ADES1|nr:RH1 [Snake adenovirus 1]A9CBA1.1 RecName: Full=Protein RH1 [Snake adenovirus 1]ABA47251.1 RH1 [Snake adenovirus 1]
MCAVAYRRSLHYDSWCSKEKTPSNHRVNCLLDPKLLLESPEKLGCYCIDHCNLHLKGQIVWTAPDGGD